MPKARDNALQLLEQEASLLQTTAPYKSHDGAPGGGEGETVESLPSMAKSLSQCLTRALKFRRLADLSGAKINFQLHKAHDPLPLIPTTNTQHHQQHHTTLT